MVSCAPAQEEKRHEQAPSVDHNAGRRFGRGMAGARGLGRGLSHHGWDDVIYNHSSLRVPGEDRKFLIKRHELLYTEVTASNLVKVSMDDDLDEQAGVNRPGFTLHGGVLSARLDVNCAVHVHTDLGMALAGLKHGLRMVVAGRHPLLPARGLSPV